MYLILKIHFIISQENANLSYIIFICFFEAEFENKHFFVDFKPMISQKLKKIFEKLFQIRNLRIKIHRNKFLK